MKKTLVDDQEEKQNTSPTIATRNSSKKSHSTSSCSESDDGSETICTAEKAAIAGHRSRQNITVARHLNDKEPSPSTVYKTPRSKSSNYDHFRYSVSFSQICTPDIFTIKLPQNKKQAEIEAKNQANPTKYYFAPLAY